MNADPLTGPGTLGVSRQAKFLDLEEFAIANEPYTWYPQRAGRVDLVLQRAMETGAINDPAQRQDIARLHIMAETAKWTGERAKAAAKAGKPQGPEGSLGKLAASNVARLAARVHTAICGNDALLTGPNAPWRASSRETWSLRRPFPSPAEPANSKKHHRRARHRSAQGTARGRRSLPRCSSCRRPTTKA